MAVDQYALTTLVKLKLYLGITVSTDDTILEQMIDFSSAWIENYTRRRFVARRYYEIRDTGRQPRVALDNYPVTTCRFVGTGWSPVMTVEKNSSLSFASVSINETAVVLYKVDSVGVDTTTNVLFASHQVTDELATHINTISGFAATVTTNVPSQYLRKIAGRDLSTAVAQLEAPTQSLTDYQIDLAKGTLYGLTLAGERSMLVDYTAGYDSVPAAVDMACRILCSRFYRERLRDPSFSSESLGGYSYSVKGRADIDGEVASLLNPWRVFRV